MHIGLLTTEYVREGIFEGGLANYTSRIGHLLCDRGHKVTVLVASNHNRSWKHDKINVVEFKSRSKCINKNNSINNQIYSLLGKLVIAQEFKNRVSKIHRHEAFDIVQTPNYQIPGFYLRNNLMFPLVCRLSSITSLWRSAYGKQRNFLEYISDWLETKIIIESDAAFAPSNFISEFLRKMESITPKVIRSPLPTMVYDVDQSVYDVLCSRKSYILFFGTLSKIKGVDLIAKIIPDIITKYPHIHFVFIGRDDGLPSGEKVITYISNNNSKYGSNIHYHPPVSQQALQPIIKNALCVVMPSRVDNYPNACLEALSLGVPVIGSNNSSLEELIVDGKTGLIVENSSADSLKEKVILFLEMSKKRKDEMKDNIIQWHKSKLLDDPTQNLLDFYSSVISQWSILN